MGISALISHISFAFEIFQISLVIKNCWNSALCLFLCSDWIESTEKCLKILIERSHKPSTLETNNPLNINVPALFNQQKPSSGGVF